MHTVESKTSGHIVTIFYHSNEIFEVAITSHGFHMDKENNIQIMKLKGVHVLVINDSHLVSHVHMC